METDQPEHQTSSAITTTNQQLTAELLILVSKRKGNFKNESYKQKYLI